MENRAQHNISQMVMVNTKIWQVERVHVMQTSESQIKHNLQPQLLPREQIWSRYGQNTYQHYIFTTNHCSLCKQK
jgi:hypothetical protein